LSRFRQALAGLRPGTLATSALLATAWQFLRMGCQVLAVIMLARTLGPGEYGALVGFTGIAMIAGTLSWLGGSYLLLEAVARQPESFGRYWRAACHSLFWIGLLLLLLYLLLAPVLLRLPLELPPLLALGASEILCYPLIYAAGFAFQAHERQGWANSLPALMAVARLLGAGLFVFIGTSLSLSTYALFHLGASLLCASLAWLAVYGLLHPAPGRARYSRAELRRGAGYLAGGLSLNTYNEMDKVMAVRALGAGAAGAYAIGYRVISMLAMPAISLAQVAQARMFRHVQAGEFAELRRLVRQVVLADLTYALFAAGVVWMAAPLLILLLGDGYESAVTATRALALLLPLLCLRLLAVTLLNSLGHPALRATLEGIAIAVLVVSTSIAAPRFGLSGLIACVIATEGLLLLLLAGVTRRLLRQRQ
jgi:O-antigen/teichoic acid export membrane protein